ncbi:MAG TPA: GIY-YIG nuclease family protein, partial [Thermomicrobiales bacterium]|nr:GIY-YIG nuclease family protein [Thermomicrobiales bacterium]
YVYIMGSQSGTLYIGITNNLERRVWEHKQKVNPGFTKRHDVTRLLYLEEYSRFDDAIAREKQLQRWSRSKKLTLIRRLNPRWNDLAWNWYGEDGGGIALPD